MMRGRSFFRWRVQWAALLGFRGAQMIPSRGRMRTICVMLVVVAAFIAMTPPKKATELGWVGTWIITCFVAAMPFFGATIAGSRREHVVPLVLIYLGAMFAGWISEPIGGIVGGSILMGGGAWFLWRAVADSAVEQRLSAGRTKTPVGHESPGPSGNQLPDDATQPTSRHPEAPPPPDR